MSGSFGSLFFSFKACVLCSAMQYFRILVLGTLFVLGNSFAPSRAQDTSWQQPLDVLSAGAAAAIVLLHICQGPEAAKQAAAFSAQKFDEEARRPRATGQAPAVVRAYLQDASEIKVKALWQANADRPCSDLASLRDMGLSTGFLVSAR